MTRTIALSEEAFSMLKRLKEKLGLSYSELIMLLVRKYEEDYKHELKELCRRLKLDEREVERMRRLIDSLRGRRWW